MTRAPTPDRRVGEITAQDRHGGGVDPFAGVIKDGYIYGRGSSDDKGMASACLEVFLLLHRMKVPLDRDVIFLAEAGDFAQMNEVYAEFFGESKPARTTVVCKFMADIKIEIDCVVYSPVAYSPKM